MPQRVIVLPNRRRVTLGEYCQSWKRLKSLPLDREVSGWEWYPVSTRDILREIRAGVHDRINRRGGVVIRKPNTARIRRELAKRIRHNCRWCGRGLGRYAESHARFCDAGCRKSFWGF